MKAKKYIFGYSRLLGSLNPIIGRGNNKSERDKDVLQDLNSMLDHDGIAPRKSIESIAPVIKIEDI